MEAVSQGDLAAVLTRNLVISRGLRAVDALLLVIKELSRQMNQLY